MFVYDPTGPHTVAAFDLLTDRGKSGVLARLFYPTDDAVDSGWQYMEHEQYIDGLLDFLRWGRWLRGFVAWASNRLRLCCAWRGAIVGKDDAERRQQLPLIVFSHGLGGQRYIYSAICLELASHGFVVAAVEHRDGSASASFFLGDEAATVGSHVDCQDDAAAKKKRLNWLAFEQHELSDFPFRNRQVRQRAAEVIQLTDTMMRLNDGRPVTNYIPGCDDGESEWLMKQFQGRIDTSRVHVMGHSFGGATALTVAITAPEGLYRSCSLHDVWMHPVDPELYDKLKIPVLFLNNQLFHWETNVTRAKAVLASPGLTKGMATVLTIRGTNHAAQSDSGLYTSQWLSKRMGLIHAMKPRPAIELSSRISRLFIARHEGRTKLTEDEEQLLNGDNPEVCFPAFTSVPDTPRHT